MSSRNEKLRLIVGLGVLVISASGVACRGFFVKPTLSSIVVTPATPSIQTGTTNNQVQMSAVGTFNDGSTGSTPVSWSITPVSVATITAGGLVKSVSTGTATVTATATVNPSITGTQTVSVTVGCIQSITLDPTSGTISNGGTTSVDIKATANTCNGPVDITSVASWFSSNTSIATVSAGVVTAVGTTGANGTVIISATSGGISSSPNATITVSGF